MESSSEQIVQPTQQDNENGHFVECSIFDKRCKNNKGLLVHLHTCRKKPGKNNTINIINGINISTQEPPQRPVNNNDGKYDPLDLSRNELPPSTFLWNKVDGNTFTNDLNQAYDRIVFWKKNMFLLPTGAAGKKFIAELTRLMYAWVNDTPMKNIALKAIHVMPALILQKPSKRSKAKDHLKAVERRIQLWADGNITKLLTEGTTIQEHMHSTTKALDISTISQKFKHLMQEGYVNGEQTTCRITNP